MRCILLLLLLTININCYAYNYREPFEDVKKEPIYYKTVSSWAGYVGMIALLTFIAEGAGQQDLSKSNEQNQRGRRMIAGGLGSIIILNYVYRF